MDRKKRTAWCCECRKLDHVNSAFSHFNIFSLYNLFISLHVSFAGLLMCYYRKEDVRGKGAHNFCFLAQFLIQTCSIADGQIFIGEMFVGRFLNFPIFVHSELLIDFSFNLLFVWKYVEAAFWPLFSLSLVLFLHFEQVKCDNRQTNATCTWTETLEARYHHYLEFTHQQIRIVENVRFVDVAPNVSQRNLNVWMWSCASVCVCVYELLLLLLFVPGLYLTCFLFLENHKNEMCVGVWRHSHDRLNKYVLCLHEDFEQNKKEHNRKTFKYT